MYKEYDLTEVNKYLKELGQNDITADSVLLKLVFKTLETNYSDCEILDLDLALACLIDITISLRENKSTKNRLSSQWLTSIALNCPQCLIGLTGYSGYLNSGMDRSR